MRSLGMPAAVETGYAVPGCLGRSHCPAIVFSLRCTFVPYRVVKKIPLAQDARAGLLSRNIAVRTNGSVRSPPVTRRCKSTFVRAGLLTRSLRIAFPAGASGKNVRSVPRDRNSQQQVLSPIHTAFPFDSCGRVSPLFGNLDGAKIGKKSEPDALLQNIFRLAAQDRRGYRTVRLPPACAAAAVSGGGAGWSSGFRSCTPRRS